VEGTRGISLEVQGDAASDIGSPGLCRHLRFEQCHPAKAALSFVPCNCAGSMSRPCPRSASEQPVSSCNLIANSFATRFALPPSQGRITQPSSNRTFQPPSGGSSVMKVGPATAGRSSRFHCARSPAANTASTFSPSARGSQGWYGQAPRESSWTAAPMPIPPENAVEAH